MKIITNDYQCGTSSSILDYGSDNVVVVSESNHSHVFNIKNEDLFFVGHEFLMYLWDNPLYLRHWKNYKNKKIIWCFEKIDCIVPEWQEKSHYSLSICQQFTDKFFASDEQDCRKYGINWLPQWSSNKFYDNKNIIPKEEKIVFSGQAGLLGYEKRDELLDKITNDKDLIKYFYISNTKRTKTWDDYISNFLNHKVILAPFGNLKAFNTRTYEALISGRVLLQQVDDEYRWHVQSLEKFKNVIFFKDYEELKKILLTTNFDEKFDSDPKLQYEENNFFERMSRIK